jgi:hypothetical protein
VRVTKRDQKKKNYRIITSRKKQPKNQHQRTRRRKKKKRKGNKQNLNKKWARSDDRVFSERVEDG